MNPRAVAHVQQLLREEKLRQSEQAILIYLADVMNEGAESVERTKQQIAAHTGLAEKTVKGRLKALMTRGMLAKQEQKTPDQVTLPNRYSFPRLTPQPQSPLQEEIARTRQTNRVIQLENRRARDRINESRQMARASQRRVAETWERLKQGHQH